MSQSVNLREMEAWETPTLEGELVRLEPLEESHLEALWEASRDPRTWRWLPRPYPTSREACDEIFRPALSARAAGSELPLVTSCHERVVGSTRYLALRPEHRSVEIGWTWLHPDVWGTGVNVEAKYLMLRHAFEVFECRRVELKTDALNERSRGAMEAMGATFEGIHRQHMLVRDGENRDSAWYSVLDSEWPDVAAGLQRRLGHLSES
jgi:RimJ/RimL family protein N-acetyltransferase